MQSSTKNSKSKKQSFVTKIPHELWDARYNKRDKALLMHVAEQYGLDPLTKEVIILTGNVYVTAAGLQRLAIRDPDYDGCEVEIVEADWSNNFFVVKASIWKKGCTHPFEDYGDADPTTSRLKGHALFRHAITRARARAMRSAFAIPFCSIEELDDEVRLEMVSKRREHSKRPLQWKDKDSSDREPIASTKMHEKILSLASKLSLGSDDLLPELHERFALSSWEKLTVSQGKELIRSLELRIRLNVSASEKKEVFHAKEKQSSHVKEKQSSYVKEKQSSYVKEAPMKLVENKEVPKKESPFEASKNKNTEAQTWIKRMEKAQNMNTLRKEWEAFRKSKEHFSQEWFDKVCQAKNQFKALLAA